MSSSSIWSRFAKGRWWFWQQHQHAKYEHPEAVSHRQLPRSGRDSLATRDAASGEDLLTQTHSMHGSRFGQYYNDHYWREVIYSFASVLVHGAAMYIFWVYVKPRLKDHFSKKRLVDKDDDAKVPKWTRFKRKLSLPFSFKRRRRCTSCHARVDKKDNFCNQCGLPTCQLCVFCGAHIRLATDNFCKACGRPVAVVDKVIVDENEDERERESGGDGGFEHEEGIGSTSSSSGGNNSSANDVTDSIRPSTSFHPRYQQHPDGLASTTDASADRQTLPLAPMEGMTKSSTESVPMIPIVQADGVVPIVPAVFVEDSDDIESTGFQQTHAQSLQLVSTDEELQNQQQEPDSHNDRTDRRHPDDQQEANNAHQVAKR